MKSKIPIKNTIITFLSSVIAAICNWGQLSLLTKTIDLELLGIYTLSLAIANPLFQFFNLQLRVLYVTDRTSNIDFTTYFNLRIVTTLFCLVLSLGIGVFLFDSVNNQLILSFIFLSYGIDAIIDIFNSRLHYNERLDKVGYSIILRSFLGFIGLLFGIVIFNNLKTAILLSVLFKLMSLIFFDYNNFDFKNRIAIKFNDKNILNIVKLGIPLGGALLMSSLNINIPKYLINIKYGFEAQGVYSSLAFIIVIGNMTISTVANILLPKMSIQYSEGKIGNFTKITLLLNVFSALVGLLLLFFIFLFKDEIVVVFFSQTLLKYSYLLIPIFTSAIFSYLTAAIGFSLITLKLNMFMLRISLISLILHVFLGFVLIEVLSIESIIYLSGFIFLLQFVLSVRKISIVLTHGN